MINKTKYIIALSLLLVSSVTPAAQLLFNFYAIEDDIAPSPMTDWVAGTPVPSMVHISFLLDTLSASTATYLFAPDIYNPSQSCLSHFYAAGLAVSNLSIQTDQGTLWSADNLSNGVIGGDNPGSGCPGGLFAGMGFSGVSNSFGWSFDPYPGLSQADFESSTDPLATLLLGFHPVISGDVILIGGWGRLVDRSTVTITAVPPPNTIVLFVSGLFSLSWKASCRELKKARCLTS